MSLTNNEIERYSRQIILKDIGVSGQKKLKKAKVLIVGAGVAGLQAIATAKRLGAVVSAFDVRSAVKEQVNSLGAKFIEVEGATEDQSAGGYAVEQTEEYKKKQAELIQEQALVSDIIITNSRENFHYHRKIKSKTYFLNNGIDTNFYKKNYNSRNKLLSNHAINKNALNVGFVGEFKKIKGINLLMDIIRQFKDNKNINFIICAGGNYLRQEFDDEFKNYKNVFNLGFVNNIDQYYSLFDIQIYTSLSEGMQKRREKATEEN